MYLDQHVRFIERGCDEIVEPMGPGRTIRYCQRVGNLVAPRRFSDAETAVDPYVAWQRRRDAVLERLAREAARDAERAAKRAAAKLARQQARDESAGPETVERRKAARQRAEQTEKQRAARAVEAQQAKLWTDGIVSVARWTREIDRWVRGSDEDSVDRFTIVTYPWEPRDHVVAAIAPWLRRWPVVSIQRTDVDTIGFRVDGDGVVGLLVARVTHGADRAIQWTRRDEFQNARATWTSRGIACRIDFQR